MFQSRAFLACLPCCVTSSIPACRHLLHHTHQGNGLSSTWQAQSAEHMTCVTTICRLEKDLLPGPFPTCAPTLPSQNAEHKPPAGTCTAHPTPMRPPLLSPLCAPIDPYSALTSALTHPLQPPLCRLTGPQGTFLMLRHHPLSSKGSPRRHACRTLQ